MNAKKANLTHAKKQCFFFENGACNILCTDTCKGCRFYKTERKFIADLKRAEKRAAVYAARKKVEA